MSPRARRLACFCLLAGLVLAVVGQLFFAERQNLLWDGAILYALGSALFLAAVRLASPTPSRQATTLWPGWSGAVAWAQSRRWRAPAAIGALLLSVGVGAAATRRLSAAQGLGLLGLWLLGVMLYVGAAADLPLAWARLRGLRVALQANLGEALLLLSLLIAAGVARFAFLGRIPFVLGGDEASMGLEAMAVLQGRLTNPFATGWLSHPTLFFYLQAAAMSWLGNTAVALRAIPALAGTLTVPAVYLLARDLFDRRTAAIAAAYLAFYHYAIHYSRLGLNNTMDPLLAVLAVLFLFRGLRSGRPAWFALSGVLLGLEQYFYMGSRVVPIFVLATLAWAAWREPGFWRRHRRSLLVLGGGFLVAGWPLLLFFARHPREFMARISALGIFQSGWLASASEMFKRSQASLLWEQFAKSVLAFHVYPDPWIFYHPGVPLLDPASAVLFTFGLVYSAAHFRERRHALLVFWLAAVLIFGSFLLENPPSSQRLVLTVVPVSIFVGLGLATVVDVAERLAGVPHLWSRAAAGLVAACLALVSLRFYFAVYTPARIYGGLNTEVAYEMGRYLRELGPDCRYYLLGAPRMYATFPTLSFMASQTQGEDVLDPLTGPPNPVEGGKHPIFLFLPERLDELQFVRLAFPAGRLREFHQPSGSLLFAAYEPSEVTDERSG